MTSLSGMSVFRYPWEVWNREFSLLSGGLKEACVATSDEGEWYPTSIQLGDGDDLAYVWREIEAIAPGLMENGRPNKEFIRL